MINRRNSPSYISSICFTFLLFVIFAVAMLTFRHLFDEDIKRREDYNDYKIISSVISVEFDNNPLLEKTLIYSVDGSEKMELYPVRQDGIVTSVVIKVANSKGYGGYIELIVGFLMDGTITNYRVITNNEKVGLSTGVSDEEFSNSLEEFNFNKQNESSLMPNTVGSKTVLSGIKKAQDAYKKFILGE